MLLIPYIFSQLLLRLMAYLFTLVLLMKSVGGFKDEVQRLIN